ncbi:MAG: hypothetical protein H8E03_01420 [Pelagibacteraceae bacterium]|nr:hypothetical protein [Pelagibacteraceae bacterium]
MPKYSHVDKGLDVLKEIAAIRKWSYQAPTNTYTVHGNLRSPGMNHKIYNADKLAMLEAPGIYARIIADFEVMQESGKGFFYRVKQKLKDLNDRIMEYKINEDGWQELTQEKRIKHKEEHYEVCQLLEKLMEDGKISRIEMLRCNELWKKYKQN